MKCEIHYVLYWINIKCVNNAGFVNEMFSLYSSSSSWELLLKGSDQYVVQAVVFVVYNLIVANYGVFNLFHGLVLLKRQPSLSYTSDISVGDSQSAFSVVC